MMDRLARRLPGDYLIRYVDLKPDDGPRGGLQCLFMQASGRMSYVHHRDMHHYELLHAVLRDPAQAVNPLVAQFPPECRDGSTKEEEAFKAARQALHERMASDPYAGLTSAYDIANRLFTRLRSGVPPAHPNKNKKPGGPG